MATTQVPKRLRYFMQRDRVLLNMVLRIVLRVIAQSLQSNSTCADASCASSWAAVCRYTQRSAHRTPEYQIRVVNQAWWGGKSRGLGKSRV